jgi:2,3-bisphosphoglycerate-independent phosphoglycerate mutase
VDDAGKAVGPIEDGDSVVIWNFRADRVVMISKAFEFEDKQFPFFDRIRRPKVTFAGMLEYDVEIHLPGIHLVDPPQIEGTSGEYLAKNQVRSFACSESVKFGHVTFFWNGNRSGYFDEKYEKYVEIATDKGIQFNEKPPMKAKEIADTAAKALKSGEWDFLRVNFPNPDMVGHTGDFDATVVGCESADQGVEVLLKAVEEVGGIYLVTADHGNAEEMVKHDKNGNPVLLKDGQPQKLTAHTCAPVPVAIGGPGLPKNVRFRKDLPNAGLANVAATFINLCGLEAPSDMEPTLLEVVQE